METLPNEMLELIVGQLSSRDLAHCSAVCRSWYETMNQDWIWEPYCDPELEEPLQTIPSVAAPSLEIPEAQTLPPISRWKMAFLREKHLFKNWSPEKLLTFKEEDIISSQNENPLSVDFFSDTLIVVWYANKIEILDVSVTPAVVLAKTDQTVSIERFKTHCVLGTDLLLVRKESQIRKSIEVFKVNIENKSIMLEYEYIFSESCRYLNLKDNFYLFVEREKLKIFDLNTGKILKEDACPEEVDQKFSVSLESVTCSPTSEFVGVLFHDSDYCVIFVYSLKHLTFLPGSGITYFDFPVFDSQNTYVTLHDHWLAFIEIGFGIKIFKISQTGVNLSDEIPLPARIKLDVVVCNGYFVFIYRRACRRFERNEQFFQGKLVIKIYSPSSKNLTTPCSLPARLGCTVVNNKFIAVFDPKKGYISKTVWKPVSQTLEECDFSVVRACTINQSFTKVIIEGGMKAEMNLMLYLADTKALVGAYSKLYLNNLW